MKKRIALVFVAVMFFTSTAHASDLSDWALADYENLSRGGILTGDIILGNLKDDITRREVCGMLVNLYERITGSEIEEKEFPFEDTDDENVKKAYYAGIVSGKSETIFDPENIVTRQEFAKMMLNMFSAANINFEPEDNLIKEVLSEYEDGEEVSDWAKKAIVVNIKSGIINGTSEKNISPQRGATREQTICMINRVYNQFVDPKKEYEVPNVIKYNIGEYGNMTFAWKEIPDAKKYMITVKDMTANMIDYFETTSANATIYCDDYETGTYTIVLGAENKDGIKTYAAPMDVSFTEPVYEPVYENMTLSEKEARVFPSGQAFQSEEEANAYMTSVTVPVWKLDSKGVKYSSKASITVNKALAEDVVNIFTEIYNSAEQFPIKDVGGYCWRNTASGNISQHSYGTCIDINYNENYYVTPDGTPITGSFWKPYENPYSIPEDGSVVEIFKKYGWAWGGNCWSDKYSKDYMHFTYLGK